MIQDTDKFVFTLKYLSKNNFVCLFEMLFYLYSCIQKQFKIISHKQKEQTFQEVCSFYIGDAIRNYQLISDKF